MSSSSNKARLESLRRQLKRLEERKAAEVARTRVDLGEGMTIDAITKLSVFSKTDLKKIAKYLSSQVDMCIALFEAEKTAKTKSAVPVANASLVGATATAQADGPWVEHAFSGEQPGYHIVDKDVRGNLIPAEQDVEKIILESYRQGTEKEGR